MINITGVVTGEKNVIARLERVTPNVRQAVTSRLLRISIDLQSYVVKNKLSGQLLRRRTGTLAASIQHKVVSTSASITAVVGSRINEAKPLKYAGIHEDGSNEVVSVREHLRMMTTAFGQAVKNPRKITVRAHSMRQNVKAKRYLAGSLDENRQRYLDELDKAVGEGAKR